MSGKISKIERAELSAPCRPSATFRERILDGSVRHQSVEFDPVTKGRGSPVWRRSRRVPGFAQGVSRQGRIGEGIFLWRAEPGLMCRLPRFEAHRIRTEEERQNGLTRCSCRQGSSFALGYGVKLFIGLPTCHAAEHKGRRLLISNVRFRELLERSGVCSLARRGRQSQLGCDPTLGAPLVA